MRDGKLLKAGDKIFNKELANTLEVIAEAGNADPFYDGELTQTIVQDIKSKGTRTFFLPYRTNEISVRDRNYQYTTNHDKMISQLRSSLRKVGCNLLARFKYLLFGQR